MLKISELAMNPKREVTTVCYGKKQEWEDREEASAYFLDAMMNSDGSEHMTVIPASISSCRTV